MFLNRNPLKELWSRKLTHASKYDQGAASIFHRSRSYIMKRACKATIYFEFMSVDCSQSMGLHHCKKNRHMIFDLIVELLTEKKTSNGETFESPAGTGAPRTIPASSTASLLIAKQFQWNTCSTANLKVFLQTICSTSPVLGLCLCG